MTGGAGYTGTHWRSAVWGVTSMLGVNPDGAGV